MPVTTTVDSVFRRHPQVLSRCVRTLSVPASASDLLLQRGAAGSAGMPCNPVARRLPGKKRNSPAHVWAGVMDMMVGNRHGWSGPHRTMRHQNCDHVRVPRSNEYRKNLCFSPAYSEDTFKQGCQPSDSCVQIIKEEWPPVRGGHSSYKRTNLKASGQPAYH